MPVPKIYNTGTSQWEPVAIGPQGLPGVVQQASAPTDTSVLWVDTDDPAEPVAIPAGGSTGQTLVKTSNSDYATSWSNPPSPNYIINGAFDIWQRGTALSPVPTTADLLADRWRNYFTTSSMAVSRQTFTPGSAPLTGYEYEFFKRVVATSANTAGSRVLIQTVLEDCRTLAGQTATLSFFAKADAAKNISLEYSQNFGTGGSTSVTTYFHKQAITTSWARYSVTIDIPSVAGKTIGPNSSFLINVWLDAGSDWNSRTGSLGNQSGTFDFWGFQLEAGSVATPFRRAANTLQGELAACARYFERIELGRVNTATSGNSTVMSLPYMTRKRSTPSVSTNATNANYGSVWTFSQSGVSTSSKSGTVTINFDGSNSGINHLQINAVGATYSPTPNTLESLSALYFDISSEL